MGYFNLTNELSTHLSYGNKTKKQIAKTVADVKQRMLDLEDRPYWVVGYGSILNERSREKTFPNAIDAVPAYIKGYRRVFNLNCGGQTVLNVEQTPSAARKLNVVAVNVMPGDMFDFILREHNYDIIEVPVYAEDGTVLDEKAVMVMATNPNIISYDFPNMSYVQANIHGAYDLGGDKFVKDYLSTTFFDTQDDDTDRLAAISHYITPYAIKHFIEMDSNY